MARRGPQEASELAFYLHSHLGVTEATAAAVIHDIQNSENSDNKMLELHAKCALFRQPGRGPTLGESL